MEPTSPSSERRRNVRIRPIAELPASARVLDEPATELTVWDVSVGGLAVVAGPRLADARPGDRLRLHLDVSPFGAFDVEVEVRHRGGGDSETIGMQLVDPPSHVTSAVGRYVAELLERGAPS